MAAPGELVQRRPAETTAIAASVALLVARAFGVDDPAVITAIAVVIGFIPTIVTWIVVMARGTPAKT